MALVWRQGRWASMAVAALVLLGAAGCGGQADEGIASAPVAARVGNPFAGVTGYVNPEWSAHVLAEPGGSRVANTPTAVWLRYIAAITAMNGGTSLRQHLDNALAQGAGYIEVVLYNLPAQNCRDTASSVNSEIQRGDVSTYRSQFIDPIASIEADSKYAGLRIINIIEPDSLYQLVTEWSSEWCATVKTSGDYVSGIRYALEKLGAIPNVYNYLDIGHHGVLGHSSNLIPAANLYASTIQGAAGGFGTVAGFVSNVANYGATVEPYFQASTLVGGVTVRQSKWVDWNSYVDEQSFDMAWRTAMIDRGASSTIGMLIDTSRNGWGGSNRPAKQSTSTDVNTFVDESRIDRRASVLNWCNQRGAGLGERPRAVNANGIQAYVWIKPPGESDGPSCATAADYDPDHPGPYQSCNPFYLVDGTTPTGALPSAPVSHAWFSAGFRELMANANPSPDVVYDNVPPSAPSGLSVANVTSSSLTLHWTAATDNVGVIAYDIYNGSTLAGSVQVTSATIQGLAPGTTYTFTVRARDAAGNASAPSAQVVVGNPCCGTPSSPSVPTNLTYGNVTYSTVTLSWTASTDEYGAVDYEVFDGSAWVGDTKSTQYDVSGLLPGTTHSFAVRAVNSKSMNSSLSTPVTVTTPTITVPSAPANLRWTASGGTVELCWDTPDGGIGPLGFSLYYGSFNLGLFMDGCVALIGFKPGTPYTFTVKTVGANGNVSVASNAVTVLLNPPPDTTPPTAPTSLAATTLSSTSVRLTWTASKDEVGVVLYQILSDGVLLRTSPVMTSATVAGLNMGQTYHFSLRAVDAAGNVSEESNVVTVTIPTL